MKKIILITCLMITTFIDVQAESSIVFTLKEGQLINDLNEKDKALSEFSTSHTLLPLVQLLTSNPLDVSSQIIVQEGVNYLYGSEEEMSFVNSLTQIASAHCKSQANLITSYLFRNKISKNNKKFFKELRENYSACGKN